MNLSEIIQSTISEFADANIHVDKIDREYGDQILKMIGNTFITYGTPTIGLFKDNKIIGAVLLDKDYLPWEYRFDIVIARSYRNKGLATLLLDKLVQEFKQDSQANQLSATVVNKKLLSILVSKYGFSSGKYEDDDFVWLTK